MGWWIAGGVVLLLVLWFVFTYNGLVSARNRTQEAWSEIDVELKPLPPFVIAGVLGLRPFASSRADEGAGAVPRVSFPQGPAGGPPTASTSGPPTASTSGPPTQ